MYTYICIIYTYTLMTIHEICAKYTHDSEQFNPFSHFKLVAGESTGKGKERHALRVRKVTSAFTPVLSCTDFSTKGLGSQICP